MGADRFFGARCVGFRRFRHRSTDRHRKLGPSNASEAVPGTRFRRNGTIPWPEGFGWVRIRSWVRDDPPGGSIRTHFGGGASASLSRAPSRTIGARSARRRTAAPVQQPDFQPSPSTWRRMARAGAPPPPRRSRAGRRVTTELAPTTTWRPMRRPGQHHRAVAQPRAVADHAPAARAGPGGRSGGRGPRSRGSGR